MPNYRSIPTFTDIQLNRFWYNVIKSCDGCWYWCGPVNCEGRGLFCYGSHQSRLAPRIMYFLFHGEIDNTLQVQHSCNNPQCVNPEHLSQGNQSRNVQYAYTCGRKTSIGESNPRAILTKEKVELIRARLKAGETGISLSLEFGVNWRTISAIKLNKSWKIA